MCGERRGERAGSVHRAVWEGREHTAALLVPGHLQLAGLREPEMLPDS